MYLIIKVWVSLSYNYSSWIVHILFCIRKLLVNSFTICKSIYYLEFSQTNLVLILFSVGPNSNMHNIYKGLCLTFVHVSFIYVYVCST